MAWPGVLAQDVCLVPAGATVAQTKGLKGGWYPSKVTQVVAEMVAPCPRGLLHGTPFSMAT